MCKQSHLELQRKNHENKFQGYNLDKKINQGIQK
jgi:hypothetical protein